MAEPTKDTIYIDIDDEITGIIDKVRSSGGKIVALVLPKRAAVFQSVVNMKLLKRSADEAKKHLVLITSEAGLLPLAGAVGIHVARTLTSKPEIPAAPVTDDGAEETVEETAALDNTPEEPEEITPATSGNRPVGELAGLAGGAAAGKGAEDLETLELDNDELVPPEAGAAPSAAAAKPKKAKKNKKLRVPNFDRFRLLLILGVLILVILIGGIYLCVSVLPKATVDIQTDATDINANATFTLDPSASSLDTNTNTVPAKQVTEQKTYTATANATGQQNNGQKATGSVTMTAQECGTPTTPDDVPAGTGVSANGQTYITQEDTSFAYNGIRGGCIYFTASPTNIIAQNAGSAYNTSSNKTSFTVAGRSDVSATGSATGGTDNIEQVVQQSDIDGAEGKINTQDNSVKQDLQQQLQQNNYYPIGITFAAGTPSTSTSASAGQAASNVTVTETVTYTMYGARKQDLQTLLNNDIKSQVDTSKQGILNDGLGNASFTTGNSPLTLTVTSTAEVGPNIDVATIKQQAAGQKSGTIESSIKNDPDVTSVTVHLSPFYVTTAPKKTSKITVNIAKPSPASSNSNANNNP